MVGPHSAIEDFHVGYSCHFDSEGMNDESEVDFELAGSPDLDNRIRKILNLRQKCIQVIRAKLSCRVHKGISTVFP